MRTTKTKTAAKPKTQSQLDNEALDAAMTDEDRAWWAAVGADEIAKAALR